MALSLRPGFTVSKIHLHFQQFIYIYICVCAAKHDIRREIGHPSFKQLFLIILERETVV